MAHNVPVTSALSLGGLLCAAVALAGQYHGTVVDADTGQPLAAAAVVVAWSKRPIVHFDGGESFHSVREAVTDAAGRFAVPDSPGIDWNPTTAVRPADILVYKPGYQALAPGVLIDRGFRSMKEVRQHLKRGGVIRLPKLTPEQDRVGSKQRGLILHIDDFRLAIRLPPEGVPALVRLTNVERRRFGLEPVREGRAGGSP